MRLAVLLASIVLMVLVYLFGEKDRYTAGLLANFPIKTVAVILLMGVGYKNNTAAIAAMGGTLNGALATVAFIILSGILLAKGLNLYASLGLGLSLWVLVSYLGRVLL